MTDSVQSKLERLKDLLGDDFPGVDARASPGRIETSDSNGFKRKAPLDQVLTPESSLGHQSISPAVEGPRLKRGQAAGEFQVFCPLMAVSKFPYKFLARKDMQRVHDRFFDGVKFWSRTWDIYFVWPQPELCKNAMLWLPQEDVQSFLREISQELKMEITMPPNAFEIGLSLQFPTHPYLVPRYLGRSTDPGTFALLKGKVPLEHEVLIKAQAEAGSTGPPSEATVAHWQQALAVSFDLNKGGLHDISSPKAERRATRLREWISELRRAERLFGLRVTTPPEPEEPGPDATWAETREYFEAIARPSPPGPIDPAKPPNFGFPKNPVFVCIDVECYEKDLSKVTEIGVASLDTNHLIGNGAHAPGKLGVNWRGRIEARHFRIEEHKHLRNGQFVEDAADAFLFSKGAGSEFVALDEAPRIVSRCFQPPFCGLESATMDGVPEALQRLAVEEADRDLILVGHDIGQDIKHLRKIGVNVKAVSGLEQMLDTANLYRGLTGQWDPPSLGSMLRDFDMDAWHLHNAGNDAVYTMWVFLATVVRSAMQREPV